jgi:acyl-CoA thioesterase-1
MTPPTSWLVYHVASGHAFFSGSLLIVLAVALFAGLRRWRRWATTIATLGAMLVAVSATPLPTWFYASASAIWLLWLVLEQCSKRAPSRLVIMSRTAMIVAVAIGVGWEAPFHFTPAIPNGVADRVYVIGDSVTAGMEEGEAVIWPRLLQARGYTIDNHARMGATAASALRQTDALAERHQLVFIEIGGNDLFGDTTPTQFEQSLERLLQHIHGPGRVLVMLEMPLPPFFGALGAIQRRLAVKHGVLLIPKRLLLGVLTAPGATLDTIHLSQRGHDQMADLVISLLGPALPSHRSE